MLKFCQSLLFLKKVDISTQWMIWPGYWFRVVANTIFIARWPHLFKTLGTVVSLLLSYGLLLLANGLFFYFGLVSLLLSIFAIMTRRRRAGSPDKRKPFVVVPSSQATSNQLYLSAHEESAEHVTLYDIDEHADK